MQLNRAMFVRSFIATAMSVLMALSSSADWTYTETNTVQNGTSKGYITDGVWTFHAERAKGDVDRLTVDASTSSKCLIKSESPAKIDFSEIDGGFKVVKFSGGYRDAASPLRKYVTEFIAPHCTTFGGEQTFDGNTNLTRVEFCKDEPLNISHNVNSCFSKCVNLVVFEPRMINGALGSMFNGCIGLEGSFEILTATSLSAFCGCSKLQEVKVEKVTTFGQQAFDGCVSLTNIVFTTPIETIGNFAFRNCHKLTTELVQRLLSKNLKQLGNKIDDRYGCFQNCTGLTGTLVIDLPNLVTNVVPGICFSGCTSLDRVEIKTKELVDIDSKAFGGVRNGFELVLPKSGIKGRFGAQPVWPVGTRNAPYPKMFLMGEIEATLEKLKRTHYVLTRDEFEIENPNDWPYVKIENTILPSFSTVVDVMKADTLMCESKKVGDITYPKVKDKRVLAFVYYNSSSQPQNGFWVLDGRAKGLAVKVR